MFELIQKGSGPGKSGETLFKSDDLAEIARVSAEKSGEDAEDLFDLIGGEE
jgi:hypothetical protein